MPSITNGRVQTVLPFGNVVVQATVTGAELKLRFENGVSALPGANGKFTGLWPVRDVLAPVRRSI